LSKDEPGLFFCLFTPPSLRFTLRVRLQPNRNYVSNDDIQTPRPLARALVDLLKPSGRILEPCAGDGAFLEAFPPGAEWCEIKLGRDFLQWNSGSVDWIITNPPWSQIRAFLRHSFAIADHVAFLMTVNHAWTRARVRDAREARFGIERIILLETPRTFPPSGFQLGLVVYSRRHNSPIQLTELPGSW
jgi:hypothetical protein